MISFRKISAASKGKLIRAYLSEGTALDDAGRKLATYYIGRDPRASWRPDMAPAVAQALGINPGMAPGDEALERLFEARRGDTGEAWTANKRSVSAYDLTASPDKSVTLAIEFARDDAEKAALILAVWRANDDAMRYVAGEIGWARRGRGGKDGMEPGEVGWASFMHFTARPTLAVQDGQDGQTYVMDVPVPGDPQTHIHNAMFNLVVTADGHVGSLDSAEMHDRVHEFGAYFQARLADELRALGIEVAYNKAEQAAVIACIPEFARDAFSKGHKATVRKAKDYAQRHGLDWDALPAERKLALLGTTAQHARLEKFDGKSDRELWREHAERIGWQHTTAITGEAAPALTREQRIDQATRFAIRHVEEEFATAAVLNMSVIRTWAARGLIGTGLSGTEDIDAVVREVEQRGITLHGEHARLIVGEMGIRVRDDDAAQIRMGLRVTNTVQVRIERELMELSEAAAVDRSGALSEAAVERAVAASGIDYRKDPEVGPAQLAAVRAFGTGGGLVFLEGAAGVGKTSRVLPPVVAAWKADGRRVIGLSQAWRQADALQDAGIGKTVAMQPFLAGIRSGDIEVDRNTVLVVDEAAQIGPRQFLELLKLWRDTGCVIRALGDREQCQAIEASSAVEIMARVLPPEALPELLATVRQKSERTREIAGLFRKGQAAEALDRKREDGTAMLVGGDYDQVVGRVASFYLERRDALREAGSKRGVTASALTNADAAEISKAIRVHLKARGELGGDEAVYAAVDNRGEQYELPVATGDRFRLYKQTAATIDGRYGFIGANGDVVEVVRRAEDGLVLRNKDGRVGHVQWRRLRDRDTGRLLLGYGHCLTVDSAQGITSGEHINALPRGSAGITAFKGYVAESRHEHAAWTMVGEWAEREAERMGRPLGDQREITEADLWARTARNMAAKPYKSLGIDLLDKLLHGENAVHDRFIRSDMRIQRQRAEGRDHGTEFADWKQDQAIRRVLEPRIEALDLAIRRNGEVIEGFRTAVADSLREMGRRMEQALRMLEQQIRRARLAVPAPAPQPPVLLATPDQPRPDAPPALAPPMQPSGGFRM